VQKEGSFRGVICNYPHLFVDLQQTVVENKRLVYAYQAFFSGHSNSLEQGTKTESSC
jgi:hypothetical protein